jgi:hypothetical protein
MSDDHRTKEVRAADELAEEIARELLIRGLPVIAACGSDMGRKIGIAFQLQNEKARYGCRCPIEKANTEWFERMYRAVA